MFFKAYFQFDIKQLKMNNSSPSQSFQRYRKFFYAFDLCFLVWAILALIYFVIITVDVSCPSMRNYFIAWTASYVLEVLAPIANGMAVKNSKYYSFCYMLNSIAILYKIAVVVSLLIGAWNVVSVCTLSYNFKLIIIIVNCLEILCLSLIFTMLWRIKIINREAYLDNLIMTKTLP